MIMYHHLLSTNQHFVCDIQEASVELNHPEVGEILKKSIGTNQYEEEGGGAVQKWLH